MEEQDFIFLQRCIQLAELGTGYVNPNPRVGAVIVKNGIIIGEGYHTAWGKPHAEVEAVKTVANPEDLKSATLYVSLEPCNHYGKTPPCTELIINAGIPRVVMGCTDPNPEVSGEGIQKLRLAGIEVIESPDPKPFQSLIAPFAHFMRTGLPWVTLKWAQSQDGYISLSGEETPITGEESRIQVHALRASHQVVLVGSRTVLIDDPRLTTRMYPGPDPQRWVWDTQFEIPNTHPFFTSPGKAFRLCYTPKSALDIGIPEISSAHSFLQWAAQTQHISSLLVEGGAETLSFFLKENAWQEILKFVNHSLFLQSGTLAPEIQNLLPVHSVSMKTEPVTKYQYLQA